MKHIPTWWKQPFFLDFKKLYSSHKKDALFFLGSGISIQANLPNWRDLLDSVLEQARVLTKPVTLKELNELYEELSKEERLANEKQFVPLKELKDILKISRVFSPQLAGKHADCDGIHTPQLAAALLLGKEFYPAIASYLKRRLDEEDETSWRELLNRIFIKPRSEEKGSPIHDAIVDLEWYGIVTTNYDTLIEDAYKRRKKQTLFVARPGLHEEGLNRRGHEKFIYKIHGDIGDPASIIALTTEDYSEIYGKSEQDGSYVETSTKANLKGVLRAAEVILFAGYSHEDVTMRNFYAEAMKYTEKGNAFALVPMKGNIAEIEEGISQLSSENEIKFIGYSERSNHAELVEFFKYLHDPTLYDAELNSRIYAKKPTVIMLYCGGTIASSKGESASTEASGPLKVTKIGSRFDNRLSDFSELLLNWYQDTYNLGSSVELDVRWEILPEEHQVFSENATPALWNSILDKVKQVAFKYFQAPKVVGDDTFLKPRDDKQLSDDYRKVQQLYDEENKEYKKSFGEEAELSHAEFISDFQSRYVLGILLLTGTDTMGYLVAALSFGFQHMPCSMVVTGSNQPPDQSIPARLPDLNKSDAWKNILTAFYFLQCFGHTLTDSFICFGDTIHHGVNVRKIASELGPVSSSLAKEVEPFVFRNLHIRGQYMFRLIDGVFCNNYYPSWIPYSQLVGSRGKELDLRHIRRDPLQRDQDNHKVLTKSDFCQNSAICHVVASPGFPRIDVNEMCAPKNGSPLRLVVIEGYASGTYLTQSGNNFEQLLYDLYQHAIPIYLISQYGISEKQQGYEVEHVRGIKVPVTPMIGLTIETALPILSLVIKEISDEEWGTSPPAAKKHGSGAGGLLEYRRDLIEKKLHSFYTARENILTYEIVPEKITKKDKEGEMDEAKKSLIRLETKREEKIQERGEVSLETLEQFNTLVEGFKSRYVFLYKRDFSLLVSEITRRDESKGAGPDGFAALCDLGFEYGLALVQAVVDTFKDSDKDSESPGNKDSDKDSELLGIGHGFVQLFQRGEAEQKQMIEKAKEIIRTITKLLRSTTVADVSVQTPRFPDPIKLEWNQESPKQSFSFTILSKRFERLKDVDEKFTAVSFSDNDADFFEKLASGCDPEKGNLEKHYNEVKRAYDKVLDCKWKNVTTNLDWLLIGIFKGVTCGIAEFLRFDDVAIDAAMKKEQGSQSVFRKAAHCFVLAGDKRYFKIELSYYQSTTLLDNASDD